MESFRFSKYQAPNFKLHCLVSPSLLGKPGLAINTNIPSLILSPLNFSRSILGCDAGNMSTLILARSHLIDPTVNYGFRSCVISVGGVVGECVDVSTYCFTDALCDVSEPDLHIGFIFSICAKTYVDFVPAFLDSISSCCSSVGGALGCVACGSCVAC